MRLLLQAHVNPGTIDRLRALSPDLDIIDVTADDDFDVDALADPALEVIVGRRAPADLGKVPRLRWLQTGSAGVDHLAADPPWARGIVVTNGRGVFAVPIGEYVTGAILRINQPVARWAADQAIHAWPLEDEPVASVVRGRTAALVGYGSIGREVARQLAALGLRILAVKPHPEERLDTSYRVPGTGDPDGSIPTRIFGVEALAEVAREADYLVLTLPLTDRSRHLIDATILAALPSRAWLVNVSRGPLVDEAALLDALRAGRLAGAVLDVFEEEPLPPDHPLWEAPNVTITPHVSGATSRFRDDLVVENVRRYLAGEPLLNVVDPERGY
ncbi:MAG TPA: D-2-hydroxyacid dehydrogenase [Candidatus Limnocylindrales bacterium]